MEILLFYPSPAPDGILIPEPPVMTRHRHATRIEKFGRPSKFIERVVIRPCLQQRHLRAG